MRRRDDHGYDRPDWLTWLTGLLTDRGYDMTSPRGGGKARLAEEAGIAPATVTRLMSGKVPDFEVLLTLARFLDVPLDELLVRVGKATADDFRSPGVKTGHTPVSSGKTWTPEELAVAAGVHRDDQAWFTTMVRRLRKSSGASDDSTAGGAAAEG